MPYVLAHQGGWDEMLVVLAPLALLALILWVATKRAADLPLDEDDDVVHEPDP